MVDQTKYTTLLPASDDTTAPEKCSSSNNCPMGRLFRYRCSKYNEKFLAAGLVQAGMNKREASNVVQEALKGDVAAQKTIAALLETVNDKDFTEDITKGSKCRPSVWMACTALTAAPGALVGGLIGGAAGSLACKPKKGACIGGAALGGVTAIPGAIVGGLLQLPVTGARKAGETLGLVKPKVMRGTKSPQMLKLLQLLGEGDLEQMNAEKKEMMTQMWSRCGRSSCNGVKKCSGSTETQTMEPDLKESVGTKPMV